MTNQIKDNAKKSLAATLTVGDFVVKKLTLQDYIIALAKMEKIFRIFQEFEAIDEKTIFANLGKIISQALPEITELLGIATETDAETIKQLDGLTVIRLFKAFFEVNDFFLMIQEVKTIKFQPESQK